MKARALYHDRGIAILVWRVLIRLEWVRYRGCFIGRRCDPSDRFRMLVGRAHIVVSFLPASYARRILRDRGRA